jgi:hypothetical protein
MRQSQLAKRGASEKYFFTRRYIIKIILKKENELC